MKTTQQYINDYAAQPNADYADQQWLEHLHAIKHPLVIGQQPYRAPIKLGLPTKENDMQDHGYETRQLFIKDYAERVKLAPEDQRALWVAHLREIKHPRMEQIQRREPVKGLAEAVATMERERAARETWREI